MSVAKVISPEKVQKLSELWHAGKTVREISDAVGNSRDYCAKMLASLGLRRPRGWKPAGFTAWLRRQAKVGIRRAKIRALPPAPGPDQSEIAAFIQSRGVTKLPPAYAAPTSAHR